LEVTHRTVLIAQGRLPNPSQDKIKDPIELKDLKNRRKGALAELAKREKKGRETTSQVTHSIAYMKVPPVNDPFLSYVHSDNNPQELQSFPAESSTSQPDWVVAEILPEIFPTLNEVPEVPYLPEMEVTSLDTINETTDEAGVGEDVLTLHPNQSDMEGIETHTSEGPIVEANAPTDQMEVKIVGPFWVKMVRAGQQIGVEPQLFSTQPNYTTTSQPTSITIQEEASVDAEQEGPVERNEPLMGKNPPQVPAVPTPSRNDTPTNPTPQPRRRHTSQARRRRNRERFERLFLNGRRNQIQPQVFPPPVPPPPPNNIPHWFNRVPPPPPRHWPSNYQYESYW
jgi:hypothetical protein